MSTQRGSGLQRSFGDWISDARQRRTKTRVLKMNDDPKEEMSLRMRRSCQVRDKKGRVGYVRMPRGSAESIVADRDLTAEENSAFEHRPLDFTTTKISPRRKVIRAASLLMAITTMMAGMGAAASADTLQSPPNAHKERVEQELGTVAADRLPSTGADTVAPVEPVTIHFRAGTRVGTGTPGVTAILNVTRDTDGAIRKIANGIQALAILRGSDAPTNIRYVVSGRDVHLSLDALGGIGVADADGTRAGHISAPWATDAHGKSLPTSYSVSGNVITQHVSTAGAAFPVVADPHYTWGWISGTVYFNHAETKDLAAGWGLASVIGGFYIPPPLNAIFAIGAATLAAAALVADDHGYCIAINYNAVTRQILPRFYMGSQGNGYCR